MTILRRLDYQVLKAAKKRIYAIERSRKLPKENYGKSVANTISKKKYEIASACNSMSCAGLKGIHYQYWTVTGVLSLNNHWAPEYTFKLLPAL